jgi:BlaI family transcriptional regulator, penicillinase repressor
MARKPSQTLTEGELRLMEVLWSRGHATVAEVTEALREHKLAYSTVLTTLRILEQKGYVKHTESGRAYLYEPLIEREAASQRAVQQLLRRFFDGSAAQLALKLLEDTQIDRAELERLRAQIQAKGRS